MKVALFIAHGTEETEAIATLDVLRRAEIPSTLVSVENEREIRTSHQVKIIADALLSQINPADFEAFVFAGGATGVDRMKKIPELIEMIQNAYQQNKWIAAICAAPALLGKAGILAQHQAVCYPGFEPEMKAKSLSPSPVCVSQNIITAKSVAYALDFGLAIVSSLQGEACSERIARQMIKNETLS